MSIEGYLYSTKRRNTGMWRLGADDMAAALNAGEKACILSCKEDNGIDRYINYFKSEHGITVTYTRMTRMEPSSNWRAVYDWHSEGPVGIELVEQKELFTGWMLIKEPKAQECDATADAQRTEP